MSNHKATNPVRVLHVVGESRFGGAATIILGLGRVAQAEGWQVDVLTTDPIFQQAVRQHGMGLVNLDVIRREIRPLWDLGGLVGLRKLLRREPYQIVHTHTSKGGFVGRLAARLAGVPVIVHTAHGFAFHERSPLSRRLFYTTLERIASQWCDQIVSVSEFHRKWAIELGMCSPSKITAIPNGIADLGRNQEVGLAKLRQQVGGRLGDLLILSIARLAPDKGLEYLLEAAAMFPHTGRRFHIVIAGEGPARDRLEQHARILRVTDQVRFVGFRQDVGDLLAACDLVVLPSLREGLSISLLEAMAAGKPIIATSIGSNREVASQGDMALLVRPGDPLSLCERILQLAGDEALMARLGANARALYESCYTENRMLQSYRQLYFDLLGENCSGKAITALRKNNGRLAAHREGLTKGCSELFPSPHESKGASMRRACPNTKDTCKIGSRTDVVRKAKADDLPSVVNIHQKAFGNFFLTRLGGAFLLKYYSLVLNYHSGIILVGDAQGALKGFACGFVAPAEFYQLMWQARLTFAPPVVSALIRHPSLITKVLYGVHRIQTPASEWPSRSCELSSIAVAPEASGNGFGKALIRAFLAQARSMDADCVYLTTDAEGNDAVNAFYRDVGFQHARRFLQHEGRWMNEYVIDGLETSDSFETHL